MQLYRAELRCAEPVGLGFSCDEPETQVFTHAGEPITHEYLTTVINEQSVNCWKCFKKNWRIKDLIPIKYRGKAAVMRF